MEIPNQASLRPSLSVAMIVRNEQDVLAESMASVRPIADEIVVLDTGSTDQTMAIATQLGAKVHQRPWSDDYAAARNDCLRLVTGDWILWLDAGERLTLESSLELRQFLNGNPERCAYRLWIEIPSCDEAESAEQALCTRLLPCEAELRFEGRVRETLEPSLQAARLGTAVAPGRIVRHVRQHDLARCRSRALRTLSLANLEAKESGTTSSRLLLATAQAHAALGNLGTAQLLFRQAIDVASPKSHEMLDAYYGLLAALDGNPQKQEMRLASVMEALETFPLDAQLLLAMGDCLSARGNLDLATRSFDAALRLGQVTPEVWHSVAVKETAAICCGLALQCENRDAEARQVLEAAIGEGRRTVDVQQCLLDLYMKLGETESALALADQMPWNADQHDAVRDAIRGACKAAQQDWMSALGHLQCAYLAGCRTVFCLRWLAVTLLSNGEVEAARPVLNEWRLREPDNVELQTYLAAVAAHAEDGVSEEDVSGSPADRSLGAQCRIDPVEPPSEGSPHSTATSQSLSGVRTPRGRE